MDATNVAVRPIGFIAAKASAAEPFGIWRVVSDILGAFVKFY